MMRYTIFFAVIVFANASGLFSLGELNSYGLGDGSLSRQEIRTPDGIVRGTLTYIDGDGKIKSISYGGDNDNIGEIQKAEPESESTSMEGEEKIDEGQKENESSEEMKKETVDSSENNQNQTAGDNGSPGPTPAPAPATLPQPVAYTPEVAAARAAHFAAREQAIYLQQLAANQEQLEASQQQLLNQQQILEYPPIFREYYGAAKPLKTLNPYYYL